MPDYIWNPLEYSKDFSSPSGFGLWVVHKIWALRMAPDAGTRGSHCINFRSSSPPPAPPGDWFHGYHGYRWWRNHPSQQGVMSGRSLRRVGPGFGRIRFCWSSPRSVTDGHRGAGKRVCTCANSPGTLLTGLAWGDPHVTRCATIGDQSLMDLL